VQCVPRVAPEAREKGLFKATRFKGLGPSRGWTLSQGPTTGSTPIQSNAFQGVGP